MISALKKLVHSDNAADKSSHSSNTPRPGLQTMDQNLQRKFAKGVQYNMKIIIKGDRNVGKSTLFYRLQGNAFKEEYLPTQEIQVASIQWNYKATDDVVKVEVWDVVDKGKKKKKVEGLKLENNHETLEDAVLDANFVDVYKGTNGVIMVFDITKQWTFEYVLREVPKVPENIPILILANHRDMGHHRVITHDEVTTYVQDLDRSEDAAQVRCAESSMRNGFGLKFIHKFFNFPFLQLQRETLLRQLETNAKEMIATNEELDIHQESEEQNYDLFLETLVNRRRAVAEQLCKVETKDVNDVIASANASVAKSSSSFNLVSSSSVSPTQSSSVASSLPKSVTVPSNLTASSQTSVKQSPPDGKDNKSTSGGFMSKFFNRQTTPPSVISAVDKSESPEVATDVANDLNQVKSVDEFVPDEDFDGSFLDEGGTCNANIKKESIEEASSDEESSSHNPMVSGFQDELDPDDDLIKPRIDISGLQPDKVSDDSSNDESDEMHTCNDSNKSIGNQKQSVKPTIKITQTVSSDSDQDSSAIVSNIVDEPKSSSNKSASVLILDHHKPDVSLKFEAVKSEESKSAKKSKKSKTKKKSKKKDKEKKDQKNKTDMDILEEFLGSSGSNSQPNENSYEQL